MKDAILITGASSGIGKECAKTLASKGYQVFAGTRTQQAFDELKNISDFITPLFIDITDTKSVSSAKQEIENSGKRLTAIVNNAGIAVGGPIEILPLESFKKQFEINLFGHINVIQAFAPTLRENNGRVINISSMASLTSIPYLGAYSASKKALDYIGNAFELETGIKTISIKPGVIRTPLWNRSVESAECTFSDITEEQQTLYGRKLEALKNNAHKNNNRGCFPQDVANIVLKALTEVNPKHQYFVGKDAFALYVVSKLPYNFIKLLVKLRLKYFKKC